jgi:hypothetical protein
VLGRQLPRQAPAHTDVTEVVHNGQKHRRRGDRAGDDKIGDKHGRKACTDCAQSARQGEAEFHQQSRTRPHRLVDSFLTLKNNEKYGFLCVIHRNRQA